MRHQDEFDELVSKYKDKNERSKSPSGTGSSYRDSLRRSAAVSKSLPKQQIEPEGDEDDWDEDVSGSEGVWSGLGRWAKALVVLAICMGISAFLAFFALASAGDLLGLNKEDKEVTFQLPEGDVSMGDIASLLEQNGVITQPLTFQIYAETKNDVTDFVPGEYQLNANMSYDQILVRFRTGNRQQTEVSILFQEGLTLQDIANRLEENKVCSAQELYDFLETESMPWEYDFLSGVPNVEERYRRFEGYLFPDTYIFVEGEDVSTVVQKFFVNFNNKIDEEVRAKIEEKGMTIDEVITLASIIQREAGNLEDMNMVSSVFQNRLANTEAFPKLQSDVTVFYVENEIKPFLGGTVGESNPDDPNQHIYDAYNTYVSDGLPVGPICNPGMDAINAVLEPTATEYLYFVADADGVTYYARTLDEHNVNVANALQKGEAHGIATS